MVLAEVLPATKLPLNTPQRYTYSVSRATSGQLVWIPLGHRKVAGVVTGFVQRPPRGFTLKTAEPLQWLLPLPYQRLLRQVASTYHVPQGLVLKLLLSGFDPELLRPKRSGQPITVRELPTLTSLQLTAYKKIRDTLGTNSCFLLQGVTGSGKTEVYAHVVRDVLARGGQGLLMVPEIAVAAHLVDRMQKYFGSTAVIWHSTIGPKQRREVWARAARGEPLIVIGPRSALWVPLPKLGCIIMDEEHDAAYKQWDQEPRFHARVAAQLLGSQLRCPVVLGSATPSIETVHATTTGALTKLTLPERFGGALPVVELVDRSGTPPHELLAPASLAALQETLSRRLQVIILLNRRGSAPLVLCQSCGFIWRCQSCERPLIWHTNPKTIMACHFCDSVQPAPIHCKKCGSPDLKMHGAGTQRIEATLRAQFPAARVARLDADISRRPAQLRTLTRRLLNGEIDILVGTQLVAKGWDLDKLNLVIVLNADQGLVTPDFRAHERTVQLLWQVAGRAGRRSEQGRVLIETVQPEHPALQAVAHHEYQRFVEQELRDRKRFGYPPYRHVLTLYRPGRDLKQAEQLAHELQQKMEVPSRDILPPQVVTKPHGKQVVCVSVLTKHPQRLFSLVPSGWSLDLDPESFA